MHIRIIYYDRLGKKRGYTTLTNKREELMERLDRLGVAVEQIARLTIDGKDYDPKKLA